MSTLNQLVILDSAGGTVTVFKHYIFPHKCKPSFVKNIIFGRLCRPNFMSQKSTVGKKSFSTACRTWEGINSVAFTS